MLTRRRHIIEDLDNLDFQGNELEQVLNNLSKINRWFGNTKQMLRAIQQEFEQNDIHTIVDIGCGGGDNLRAIASWFEKENRKIKLIGIDGNAHILEYAKSKDLNIEYRQADILAKDFKIPECDVLISSHFIYHFHDEKLISFLQKAQKSVKQRMIFSELERSWVAYFLFAFTGGLLGRMIQSDGLKAIQRSFKTKELIWILKRSGFNHFYVKRKPWFRLLIAINCQA